MRPIAGIILTVIFTIELFLILSCTTAPTNPYDISNTKITLYAQSSSGVVSASGVEDTAGNIVKIGAQCNYWNYADSMQFRQVVRTSTIFKDSILSVKKGLSALKYNDTVWQNAVFNEMGTKTIKAMVYLNNGNIIADSVNVVIYSRPAINHPPVWQKDTINIIGHTGALITITLSDKCSDADGDTLYFSLLSGPPAGDAIANPATNATYIFTPDPDDTGMYYPRIIAKDPKGLADTLTIALSIRAQIIDSLPPAIILLSPSKDTVIGGDSCVVRVKCTDSSGVASVAYTFGAMNISAIKTSDSVWTGTVSGLVSGALNKIIVIATDASVNSNKDTITLFIKYDSTMTDVTGPAFFPKSGPANNTIVVDSSINIIDSIYDPSGVDSVYWTLNGKNPKPLTLISGATNLYSLADTLRRYHLDTIVIFAQDKTTNHNKSSQTIVLNYNVPPVTNDTAVFTNRNTAITWVLNAKSVDGDPLTWMRLTSPSATSGAVTGTLPSVTFTPVANWYGADSFKVQVSDGHWSDTVRIKITVVNVNVAPSIVTPPSSMTKNVGQSVTFSVAINADVNPAPSFQWKQNGSTITNATASSYTIGSIALSDSGSYTVTVTNSAGTISSQPVTLTVNYVPTITTQPISQTLYLNQPDTFSVVASGKPMPTYTWKKNGVVLGGQTGASLILPSPGVNDSGKYTVTVANSLGSAISDTARFYAGFKSVAAGGSHSLILKTDGSLFSCGNNSNGQLGDGTTTNRDSPMQIMTGIQSVAAGGGHSLILKKDGTLLACGYNSDGELGDGTTTDRHSPVQIMTNVQSVSAGVGHSLILKTDGTFFACGLNYYGQLGDGTTNNDSFPEQIMTGVLSIIAGGNHSLILNTDGTMYAWGDNFYGQLGDGTTTDRHSPEQIMAGVQGIAAGENHSLILKTDGTLFTCGYNLFGQLGDGTTTDRHSPIQIMTGVQNINAGGYQSFILKSNGTLFACGSNNYGQLGDGTLNNQDLPVQITTGVQSIAAGENHSFILMSNRTLFACGSNSTGQLGNGNMIDQNTMVQIRF